MDDLEEMCGKGVVELVYYHDHDIVLTGKARWEVRQPGDPTVYFAARTVGECQAAVDEVLEDM